jgi:hypothetical protein
MKVILLALCFQNEPLRFVMEGSNLRAQGREKAANRAPSAGDHQRSGAMQQPVRQ